MGYDRREDKGGGEGRKRKEKKVFFIFRILNILFISFFFFTNFLHKISIIQHYDLHGRVSHLSE